LTLSEAHDGISFMAKPELKIEKLTSGNGPAAKKGDTVKVHYTGQFMDGRKFDSSLDRKEPFAFVLGAGQVIEGWDIGVASMKVGDKVKLTIPPELAYGSQGYPGAIPPNSTLMFEVELVGIG
jgi:FKBP-type peptidyl-prolyl cis-trans isomerase FkpA